MKDRSSHFMAARRVRDRSIILLLFGLALLISPMASIFEIDAKLGGIPFTLIYLFVVWAILVAGCAYLSKSLWRSTEQTDETATEPRR